DEEARARDEARARALLLQAKQYGFSDRQLAHLWHLTEDGVRRLRKAWGVVPTYKRVDTCAAEFEAYTPYYYSTYEAPVAVVAENEERRTENRELRTEDPSLIPHSPFSDLRSPLLEDETVAPAEGKERILI